MKKNIIYLATLLLTLSACDNASQAQFDEQTQVQALNVAENCNVVNYLTGDPEDVSTKTESLTVLMGGGKDVDMAFKEMIKKSGGGDFVILRVSGADGYNPYVYTQLGGVNSVETLMIDSKEKANCPEIEQKIINAEAVFISGGDQSKYYTYWNNSKVKDALNFLINTKKVPLGGTSAGLAILGETVYTAENASVDSEESLRNPLTERITLKKDFLTIPLLKNTITDTHFAQRNRQGRLISFMANSIKNEINPVNVKGIGVDEGTAYVLDSNGIGKVYGSNNAWFFRANSAPEMYNPLTWSNTANNQYTVKTLRVKGSENGMNSFNIIDWKLNSGTSTEINYSVEQGKLLSTTR